MIDGNVKTFYIVYIPPTFALIDYIYIYIYIYICLPRIIKRINRVRSTYIIINYITSLTTVDPFIILLLCDFSMQAYTLDNNKQTYISFHLLKIKIL